MFSIPMAWDDLNIKTTGAAGGELILQTLCCGFKELFAKRSRIFTLIPPKLLSTMKNYV